MPESTGALKTTEARPFGASEGVLLGITSLVWGAAYVFIRQGLELGAAPLAFAAARYVLSALGFAAIALAWREPLPSRRAFAISASLGGILIIGLYGGFLYWGEQYTTGGYAAVLASTAPLLTVAISFPILAAERLGRLGLIGIGVGLVGATVLVYPQLAGSSLGDARGAGFVLAAMICTATGTVVLRRVHPERQGLWQIGTQFAVAGLLLGTAALAIPGQRALPASFDVLASLAALVGLSSLVGYFTYFAMHHRVGPIRANLVAYLVPIVGVGVGSGFFGEPVTLFEGLGVVIVLVGVTLVLRDRARPPPSRGPREMPSR